MIICPACQRSNALRARFCAGCGQAVDSHGPRNLAPTERVNQEPPPPARATGRTVFVASLPVNTGMQDLAETASQGALSQPKFSGHPPSDAAQEVGGLAGGDGGLHGFHPPSAFEVSGIAPAGPVSPSEEESTPVAARCAAAGLYDARGQDAFSAGEDYHRRVGTNVELPAETVAGVELGLDVELNLNRLMIEGHGTTFELRLRNRGGTELRNLQIELTSRAFASKPGVRHRALAGGTVLSRPLEVDPVKSGVSILHCLVSYESEGCLVRLKGRAQLQVHVPPKEGNLSVSVGKILSDNDQGSGTGADVRIGTLVDIGKIKTINDLISVVLPNHFVRVELEPDHEASTAFAPTVRPDARPVRIPLQFLANVAPASRLTLIPVRNAREEGGDLPSICVVAAPLFRIGRKRELVDYVSWFWPRSKENDELTSRISRGAHVSLRLENGLILVEDTSSTNGSFFDGAEIPQRGGASGAGRSGSGVAQVVMDHDGILTIARAYRLELAMLGTTLEGPLRISNEHVWPGPPPEPQSAPCAAVRLTPLGSEVALHHGVWLFTDATLGSGAGNAVVLEAGGVAGVHARVLHYRSQFWIETVNESEPVRLNGSSVNTGEIIPLVEEQRVRIGELEYRVAIRRI